ncbi:MAG: MFS transporter [Leptospiraceae bacterium]|nr:MFS transporter [Leptospiraceae bacterium]
MKWKIVLRKSSLLLLALICSTGLNLIAPNILEIASTLKLDQQEGLFSLGGVNYFLIYIPMGFASLFLYFIKKHFTFGPTIFAIILGLLHLSIFFVPNLTLFYIINLLIGIQYGLFFPLCYQYLKKISQSDRQMESVGQINIAIGVGLALGQYLAGIMGQLFLTNGWRLSYLISGFMILTIAIFTIPLMFRMNANIETKTNSPDEFKRIHSRFYFYFLLQYIPGCIPWGALTVYIFPYIQNTIKVSKLVSVNMITLLGVGMVLGTYLAAIIGDRNFGKNKEKGIFYLIIFSFVFSEVVVFLFLYFLQNLSTSLIYFFIFLAGIVLAFPGTYIKGLLFINLNENETRIIFSIENFLESIGKGLGPFIVSILILVNGNMLHSMFYSILFWNLSILLIILAFQQKRKIYEI